LASCKLTSGWAAAGGQCISYNEPRRPLTYGAALLIGYASNDNFSVTARAEIIASTGNTENGAPNLLYGPGSSAWSVYFVRGEASLVKAENITPGFAFGASGNAKTQARFMLESGVSF
jgi:hypothetical protein